ncbi:MAG: hypothetical protein AAGJ35_16075, partial [Myxococcota bacterium]
SPARRSSSRRASIQKALQEVPIPPLLEEGVHVLRVNGNGSVTTSFLSLSKDRFTLYVTSGKVGTPRMGLFRKSRSSSLDQIQEKKIDIGSIDRIQRGQQTHKFELAK